MTTDVIFSRSSAILIIEILLFLAAREKTLFFCEFADGEVGEE